WEYDAVGEAYYNDNTSVYIDGEDIVLPINSVFDDKTDVKLEDIHFLTIELSEKPDSLTSTSDFSYNVYWAKSRKGWMPTIRIKGLVLKGSDHKLLSSFSIVYNYALSKTNEEIIEKEKFEFVDNSVLADGDWVKISIDKSGVYKIDQNLLGQISSELGVSIASIDPRNIAIFGAKGGMLQELNSDYDSDDLVEFAIDVIGQDDGKFDTDDYILFYAQGPVTWTTNTSTGLSRHNTNIYSDNTFVYFTIKEKRAKRIEFKDDVNDDSDVVIETFNSYDFHEVDEVNFMQSGQMWFGERFERNTEQTFLFDFPNRNLTKDINVYTSIGSKPLGSTTLSVRVNGNHIYNFNENSDGKKYYVRSKKATVNSLQNLIDVSFSYSSGGGSECLLNYIEVNAESFLIADNLQYSFRSIHAMDTDVSEYRLSKVSGNHEIWNITNPLSPKRITLKSFSSYSSFKEKSSSLEEYQLLSNKDFYIPEIISKISNQNLHGVASIDYLIVTHESLNNSANKLADIHRARGLSVIVVDVEDIYNEFSSGRQDLVAIRQIARMIYQKGSKKSRLKYLLLFGDTSYDFKERIKDNNNLVPSYQSYQSTSKSSSFVSDDYFGFMDDHEGGNISGGDLIDIAIGRIPVRSDEEGLNVVEKIEDYYSIGSTGDWRNKVQFVSDDYATKNGSNWEIELMKSTENLSNWLSDVSPNYNHQKVHLDSYEIERTSGGNFYRQAHIDFMQNVQKGNLVTNFFGHGSEVSWTGEGLFHIDDIDKFTNLFNLPLFITITCEFSRFDNPELYSGGEKLLSHYDGGAIGLISTTREITIGAGGDINRKLFEFLFPENPDDYLTLGEVLMETKNSYRSGISKRIVSLLGDPALMLAYPKKEIKVNTINYNDQNSNDTLKSLMKVHIEGEIAFHGQKDTSFNGVVYPLIYDKKQELESLDNNSVGEKVPYWLQNNVIYKGKSTVKDGEFVIEFVVPKDINFSFGNGKVSLYAIANDGNIDAVGNDSDIIVGGIDITSDIDVEGPEVALFMNNEFFDDGGITNSSPIFMARLNDESGINTVGNGIGHDLKMTLIHDDTKVEILLNEYYESDIDDYTSGKVSYPLLGLQPGGYSIEFTSWDVFNNSSYSSLSFNVESDDAALKINDSYNYPNPFSVETIFKFSHNQPNKTLSIHIDIFAITGELVKTIVEHNITDGFVVKDIVWAGTSDSGALLPSGTYIYKVNVTSDDGTYSNQEVNKIMIIR
ncbi:MAG: type IX secretion system sortase PorU, partial [Flavobacteriales bacterium]|nr:type IX secretion system sortase PorU [Flavobacteriales bacterium]